MELRKGGGEPLLLIHGLGASARIWEPVLDRLAAEREAVALDLPGFGDALDLPAGVEPTAANLAAAMRAGCERLGIERPHVAGNSLGGWVGLEMGRAGWAASSRHPGRSGAQPAPASSSCPRSATRRCGTTRS
jgi:pimeloyl-ACP methyl ester carboxylesterase